MEDIELPDLPDWLKMDNLGGLVPSEMRQSFYAFARSAILADREKRAQAAQGWLPIDTAPEDGTPIIIARIEDGCVYDVCNGHIENVLEDEEDGPWGIRGGEPWCSYVGRPRGTYFCSWLPGRERDERWRITPSFEYTHWMPTPIPSTTEKEQTP